MTVFASQLISASYLMHLKFLLLAIFRTTSLNIIQIIYISRDFKKDPRHELLNQDLPLPGPPTSKFDFPLRKLKFFPLFP